MSSGRLRWDDKAYTFTRRQKDDPNLFIDDVSSTPRPVEQREDNPPELNEETGLATTTTVPDPVAVSVVPGNDPVYTTLSAHGYTVTCFSQIPKQILNAQDYRIRAVIRNTGGTGTLAVSLGSSADEAKADGYTLETDNELEITSTVPVWGCVKTATSTDNAIVAVWTEYAWANA